ncbi:MAG: hypothetical protein LBH32_10200 [Dysgonamonadaceae bacterium]|nr:hypothetical protein [Dysgonamonadaceae bacterium]
MKKLVLFTAIVAVVALSACKKEAPAQAPSEPAQTEEVVPATETPATEAAEETPAAEAPAETPAQ